MLVTNNVITLELPAPLNLTNRNEDAIMFQFNGMLYTGYCDLLPKEDPVTPGKQWFRISSCTCHGLIEDEDSMYMALARLEWLANGLEF